MKKSDFDRELEVHVTRYGRAKVDLQSMFEHPRFQQNINLLRKERALKEGASSDGTASNSADKEAKPSPTG